MSGWLNLNESLNSIKGQITTFASNVLAEDQDPDSREPVVNEDWKGICREKDVEIENLRRINEELQKSLLVQRNGDNTWEWTTPSESEPKENISDLKATIKQLEIEKGQLINQLEELDEENQQNLVQINGIKEKLQEENSDLKDKYLQLKKQISREENFKSVEETSKELSVLKATHETLLKTFKDSKSSLEKEIEEITDKFKAAYSELQKAKEIIKVAELKSLEDEKDAQKLAIILESYDKQVTQLKQDLDEAFKAAETLRRENQQLKSRKSQEDAQSISLEKDDALDDALNRVKTLQEENQNLKLQQEALEVKLKKEFDETLQLKFEEALRKAETLQQENEHLKKLQQELQENLSELKKKLDEALKTSETLQQENQHLKTQQLKLDEALKTTETLQQENQHLKSQWESVQLKLEEKLDEALKATETLQQENQDLKTLQESLQLQLKEERIENQLSEASKSIDNTDKYEAQISNLSKQLKELNVDKEKMHNKYINIITDNIKHYIDSEAPSSQHQNEIPENTHLTEFSKQVENLFKILLEFKQKSETLEKELIEASNEKTKILKEKYEEIEKLIQNSEVLSQEIIKKSETIKELEAENSNLMASNDMLLSELDSYKNSGLQTISESNEDNMVLLENDLDNANKRIKELEEIIDSPSKTSSYSLEAEISQKQENYQELLDNFDDLKSDYDELTYKIKALEEGNEDLKNNLEKYKSDFENTDYQLSEANIVIDGLREELDTLKFENKELKLQNMNSIDLKTEFNDLREKWLHEENLRREFEAQLKMLTEELQCSKINETSLKLQYDTLSKEHFALIDVRNNLEHSLNSNKEYETNILQKYEDLMVQFEELNSKFKEKEEEIVVLNNSDLEKNELIKQFETRQNEDIETNNLQQQLHELTISRNDLINMVTIKHQENVNYHNEIQRLTEILKGEVEKYSHLEAKLLTLANNSDELAKKNQEIDKLTDQNNFLKEKCDILTKNLLEEQQLISEKSKQLERLQDHLMEVQEHYTQELLEAEQKNAALQSKLSDLEMREKNSSTMYTSVSIRANQQVEALQSQLQLLTSQREESRRKLSDAEDLNNKQAAALANLQFVLEQFQKDKEKDVQKETERIRRQIDVEKRAQNELRKEIENLKGQLEESKIGLQAAARLSDQLEMQKKQNSGLKDEVSQLQQNLAKTQQTIDEINSQTDGKIDKSLIKSLMVGFLSSNNNNWNKDQTQVLKLIATVLDFNQQDHDKVKLDKRQQGGSWLSSLMHPNPQAGNSQESLSQAFVRFLENESKPRVVPSLLEEQSGKASSSNDSTKRNTPRASPIVLNEMVLPTFADFGQSRNSSSILKDVLKDNNS